MTFRVFCDKYCDPIFKVFTDALKSKEQGDVFIEAFYNFYKLGLKDGQVKKQESQRGRTSTRRNKKVKK